MFEQSKKSSPCIPPCILGYQSHHHTLPQPYNNNNNSKMKIEEQVSSAVENIQIASYMHTLSLSL